MNLGFVISNYYAIRSDFSISPTCKMVVNGTSYDYEKMQLGHSIFDEGTVLATMGCNDPNFFVFITGYLKDKY